MRWVKKSLKVLGILLVLLLVVGSVLFVNVWYFKPFDINLFFCSHGSAIRPRESRDVEQHSRARTPGHRRP